MTFNFLTTNNRIANKYSTNYKRNIQIKWSDSKMMYTILLKIMLTVLYPQPWAILEKEKSSWFPASVGWPPTESWAPLLMTICLKFSRLDWPTVAMAPMCIITEPSPSRQKTCLLGFCMATPRAIVDVCPIEPTVKKSFSWPMSLETLYDNDIVSVRKNTQVLFTNFYLHARNFRKVRISCRDTVFKCLCRYTVFQLIYIIIMKINCH